VLVPDRTLKRFIARSRCRVRLVRVFSARCSVMYFDRRLPQPTRMSSPGAPPGSWRLSVTKSKPLGTDRRPLDSRRELLLRPPAFFRRENWTRMSSTFVPVPVDRRKKPQVTAVRRLILETPHRGAPFFATADHETAAGPGFAFLLPEPGRNQAGPGSVRNRTRRQNKNHFRKRASASCTFAEAQRETGGTPDQMLMISGGKNRNPPYTTSLQRSRSSILPTSPFPAPPPDSASRCPGPNCLKGSTGTPDVFLDYEGDLRLLPPDKILDRVPARMRAVRARVSLGEGSNSSNANSRCRRRTFASARTRGRLGSPPARKGTNHLKKSCSLAKGRIVRNGV